MAIKTCAFQKLQKKISVIKTICFNFTLILLYVMIFYSVFYHFFVQNITLRHNNISSKLNNLQQLDHIHEIFSHISLIMIVLFLFHHQHVFVIS